MMATSDKRDILTLALTGTRYSSGGATPQTSLPIDQLPLAEEIAAGEAERALLLRAGAWAIYRRAGYLPAAAPQPSTPAPEETRPACSPGAGEALAEILRTRRFDLLPEALERMNAAELRLPPALLPMALSSVGLTLELRAMLAPALGERGRWLAGFNRAWAWAAERPDDLMDDPAHAQTVWETGTLRQRVVALLGMRHRDPAAARDLLAAEWTREQAKARATLLRALEVSLSPEDEPLLEQALADRAAAVRMGAVDLLVRLPESALAQRMRHGAEVLLYRTETGALDAEPVSLLSAQPEDEQWMRDTLEVFRNGPQGANRIVAALCYIHPEQWETRFGQSPDALVASTNDALFRSNILRGWTEAAARFGSTRWAEPLWNVWLEAAKGVWKSPKGGQDDPTAELELIAPLTPREALDEFALALLANPNAYGNYALGDRLDLLPRPWSATAAGAFLRAFGDALEMWAESAAPSEPWTGALPLAAMALPDSQFAQAREVCAIADDQHRNLTRWRYQLASFLSTLDLRARVIKEIPLL